MIEFFVQPTGIQSQQNFGSTHTVVTGLPYFDERSLQMTKSTAASSSGMAETT